MRERHTETVAARTATGHSINGVGLEAGARAEAARAKADAQLAEVDSEDAVMFRHEAEKDNTRAERVAVGKVDPAHKVKRVAHSARVKNKG
jgi:hypothetical protein